MILIRLSVWPIYEHGARFGTTQAQQSGLHLGHVLEEPVHGLRYILPNGSYIATPIEASTAKHNVNYLCCIYVSFNNKKCF